LNFLSHYYFDKQANKFHFNLGLLFPDLVRNFIKGAKLKTHRNPWIHPMEIELYEGCMKHVISDKLFHNWEGFIDGMDLSNKFLRRSKEEFQKDFFISHILVELVIDKILLNRYPNLANDLYEDYSRVDRQVITRFLNNYSINDSDLFFKGFDRFMEVQYLKNYKYFSNIVYALGRICTKMRLAPFSEYQKKLIDDLAQEIEEFEKDRLNELEVLLTNEQI